MWACPALPGRDQAGVVGSDRSQNRVHPTQVSRSVPGVTTLGHLSGCLASASIDSGCRPLAGIGIFQQLSALGQDPDSPARALGEQRLSGRWETRPQRLPSENWPSRGRKSKSAVCLQADKSPHFNLCLRFTAGRRGSRRQVLWGPGVWALSPLPRHFPGTSPREGLGAERPGLILALGLWASISLLSFPCVKWGVLSQAISQDWRALELPGIRGQHMWSESGKCPRPHLLPKLASFPWKPVTRWER